MLHCHAKRKLSSPICKELEKGQKSQRSENIFLAGRWDGLDRFDRVRAVSAAAIWILYSGDKTSDEIRERLEGAALRVWPKAESWARQELWGTSLADDSAVVSDVWEESLQSVSRSLQRKTRLRPIRDLDSYLFGTFCHRLRRRIS
jgi:hypothetical protein